MKKVVIMTLVAAVAVLAVGCKKDQGSQTEDLTMGSVTYSACKSYTDKLAKAMEPWGDPDSAAVTYDEGTLHVTHFNVLVNCVFEEVGVEVDLTQSVDTITIEEHETRTGLMADCMCSTDCSYDIKGVKKGHHVLVFKNWYPEEKVMSFEW
ncbi:MAG: hypothetical protein IJL38_00520 [Bacteroidales bacterium]|nr:hypothetical protein [Bacteroidales bacterium]